MKTNGIYFSMGDYAFREIREDDLPLLLKWRNSPFVHSKMFTDHKITWEEHINWFRRSGSKPDQAYFIFTYKDQPIGYSGGGGIYLGEPDKCPLDAGLYLSFMSNDYAFSKWSLEHSEVEVLASNKKALQMNEFMGYEFDRKNGYYVTKDGAQTLVFRGFMTREKWLVRRAEILDMLQIEDITKSFATVE